MGIPVDLHKLPEILKRTREEMRGAVLLGARNGARGGRALLVRKTPKDMGLLKASWRDTASRPGSATRAVVAEIHNDAPYAGIVEMGARPHPVSEAGQLAIFEWVKRHFYYFAGRDRHAFLKRRKFTGVIDTEAKEIAGAIVWRIRHYGQKPTYFVRDSRGALTKLAGYEINRALRNWGKAAKNGGGTKGGPH